MKEHVKIIRKDKKGRRSALPHLRRTVRPIRGGALEMSISKVRLSASRRGETGIGATIILMSLLLVSGSAASLIIDTNSDSAQQAEQTAQDALSQVSTGLDVVDLIGHYDNGKITSLEVLVRLGQGSAPINLDHLLIKVMTTTSSIDLSLNSTSPETRFTARQVCLASDLPAWSNGVPPLVGQGDLVKIVVDIPPVAIGQSASIKLIPAEGHATLETFTVPDNIVGTVVSLR